MQLDTQKDEVSQYLRSAHANRYAEARVSRCMNTRHAEGQMDVEVSSGMAREHAKGHVYAHVSPRMQPEACGMTHMCLGGESLLAGVFYIYSTPLLIFIDPKTLKDVGPKYCREVRKDCPEVKEGSFRVLISPYQSIQDIDVGFLTSETASDLGNPDRSRCQFVDPRLETMSGLTGRGPESGGLGLTWLDHQGRVSHVDVTAPGESDRGPGHGDSD
ncbi:hypothetical protein F2Q69_00035373 [Brassica cretica]|uniref:Uncharacterized protein n=1 Tax=Brassica cretica TaxID=69181 RepID=A0A8S9SCI5_BRACR|nr:hypothetical protein F2Q69_00035373 [Brassica cretica]